jgi:hypothetical protein
VKSARIVALGLQPVAESVKSFDVYLIEKLNLWAGLSKLIEIQAVAV